MVIRNKFYFSIVLIVVCVLSLSTKAATVDLCSDTFSKNLKYTSYFQAKVFSKDLIIANEIISSLQAPHILSEIDSIKYLSDSNELLNWARNFKAQSQDKITSIWIENEIENIIEFQRFFEGKPSNLFKAIFSDSSIYFNKKNNPNFPLYLHGSNEPLITNVFHMGGRLTTINLNQIPEKLRPSIELLFSYFLNNVSLNFKFMLDFPLSYRVFRILSGVEIEEFVIIDFQKKVLPYENFEEFKNLHHSELFNRNLDFVMNEYSKRMQINLFNKRKLTRISEELKYRSILILQNTKAQDVNSSSIIKSSILFVVSGNSDEPLPLELFTGYKVSRKFKNEKLVEIGRFAVSKNQYNISPDDLIFTAAQLAYSDRNVSRIIIEADKYRARLFAKKYGFRTLHKQQNFNNEAEYIMEITPLELMKKINRFNIYR